MHTRICLFYFMSLLEPDKRNVFISAQHASFCVPRANNFTSFCNNFLVVHGRFIKMTSIPNNNLKERLLRLGYNPDGVKLTAPVLDNSKIIKVERKVQQTNIQSNQQQTATASQNNFKLPVIVNLDEWSDFEDE